jgi:copper chaperone NosL
MRKTYVILLTIFLFVPYLVADETGSYKPSARDKCPVCGMFVSRYHDWITVVRFRDGSQAFFDGPKDMFKYYCDVKHYAPSKSSSDMVSFQVMDYYTLTPIDGREAYYVIGSDIFGPMGKELIPFKKQSDAKGFLQDHKGKDILRFTEVTRPTLKGLDQ